MEEVERTILEGGAGEVISWFEVRTSVDQSTSNLEGVAASPVTWPTLRRLVCKADDAATCLSASMVYRNV